MPRETRLIPTESVATVCDRCGCTIEPDNPTDRRVRVVMIDGAPHCQTCDRVVGRASCPRLPDGRAR